MTDLNPGSSDRIDVGDTRTVRFTATDADGDATALTDAAVTVYPPTAADSYDATDDLTTSGDAQDLAVTFTEAGRWTFKAASADAGQVEWYAATVTRPAR